jgi:flagellar hook-length control protein FliK
MIQNAALLPEPAAVATAPTGKAPATAHALESSFAKALKGSNSSGEETADGKVVQNDAQAAAGPVKSAHLFRKTRTAGSSDSPNVQPLAGENVADDQSVSLSGQLNGAEAGMLANQLQLGAGVQQPVATVVAEQAGATEAVSVKPEDGKQQEMSGLQMLAGQNPVVAAAPADGLAKLAEPKLEVVSPALPSAPLAASSGEIADPGAATTASRVAEQSVAAAKSSETPATVLAAAKDAQAFTAGAGTMAEGSQQAVRPATPSTGHEQQAPVIPGVRQSAAVAYLFPGLRSGARENAADQAMSADEKAAGLSAVEQQTAPAPQQTPTGSTGEQASIAGQTAPVATAAPADGSVAMDDKAQAAAVLPAGAEAAQKEPAVAGDKGKEAGATGLVVEQHPARVENAAADAHPFAEKAGQVAADAREPVVAEGARKPHLAERNAAQQMEVAPKAPVAETSGAKLAAADISGQDVSQPANSGQAAFGDAEQKGHSEQKAQGKSSEQLQPMGIGVQPQVAAETAQAENKQAATKTALHESILSQVKDGVVTHDGKGNGQMSIRLNPGELGELKIDIRMVDNRLKVEVQAENRMVKDLLMGNLETLKEALTSKNLSMEGFDVSTGGGAFNSQLPEERRNTRQQPALRLVKGGGYPGDNDGRVNYVTAEVNNLLDVKF